MDVGELARDLTAVTWRFDVDAFAATVEAAGWIPAIGDGFLNPVDAVRAFDFPPELVDSVDETTNDAFRFAGLGSRRASPPSRKPLASGSESGGNPLPAGPGRADRHNLRQTVLINTTACGSAVDHSSRKATVRRVALGADDSHT